MDSSTTSSQTQTQTLLHLHLHLDTGFNTPPSSTRTFPPLVTSDRNPLHFSPFQNLSSCQDLFPLHQRTRFDRCVPYSYSSNGGETIGGRSFHWVDYGCYFSTCCEETVSLIHLFLSFSFSLSPYPPSLPLSLSFPTNVKPLPSFLFAFPCKKTDPSWT